MLAFALVLSTFLGLCFSIQASSAETIRFTTIDYCPFTCDPLREDGQEGFMTDFLKEVFESAGYELEIDMFPYVRAVKYVEQGKYDGIVVVGKEYAPRLVYPDEPTVAQPVVFLVNSGMEWRYRGIRSLSAVRVGTVGGFYYSSPDLMNYFKSAQRDPSRIYVIYGEDTTRRAIRMLLSGRITTLVEGEFAADYELQKMGLRSEVVKAGYTSEDFDDYTAFSPHHPKANEYARLFSRALKKFKRSGRLRDILSRYGISLTDSGEMTN